MKRWFSTRAHEVTGAERATAGAEGISLTVSRVLATGLALSVALLLVGAVMVLVGRGPSPSARVSLTDLPRALASFEPGGFLDLGLVVLLATPVARVVALVVGFARRKVWLFCGISLAVLALLVLGAYLGLKG